jgi:hypothetical protein
MGQMLTMLSTFIISNGSGAIRALIYLVVVGVVFGLVFYLVKIAPFIPAGFKRVLLWFIIVCGILFLINFVLGLFGHPLIVIH